MALTQTGLVFLPTTEQNYQPRPYQGQVEPDDGQWIRPAKDYASTRYSSLDQINADNAKTLKLAFTFSTGMTRGHEAAPLVVNNTMYIVTPFPNKLYALDLTKPGAPMKWVYQPMPTPASQGVACCDVVNRGASYADGKIYYNTLDNQTVAVDAKTGREVWKTRVGDINKGESMTMAPLVVKGKVLVGNSGGEIGIRGWLTALDAKTGRDCVARLHRRSRQRCADRTAIQAILSARSRTGSRREKLASRCVENWRRRRLGMDFLRS